MTLARPKNILVAGLHKSGTTGLYEAVKRSVPDHLNYALLFEPKDPWPFVALARYAPERPILTKILVHRLRDCDVRYTDFDARLMTVRDPRDIVVSRLLFRPMFGWTSYSIERSRLDEFSRALKQKVAEPSSYSVKALHELADDLGMGGAGWDTLLAQIAEQVRVAEEHGFHLVRYEDFVEDRLAHAGAYLGMTISNPRSADLGWLSHIPRSMGYGEWRHWFLDEDVRFFGEMFRDYMRRYGYDDWSRPADPVIDPATSSEYVAGKVARHIEDVQKRSSDWSVDSVTTTAALERLRSMAEDGRARWAHRLALVLAAGTAAEPDPAAAVHWAREAAVRGSADGMRLLAELLADHAEDACEARGERRFWLLEAQRVAEEKELRREIADLRQRLRKCRKPEPAPIRGAPRHRVSSLLAAGARDAGRRVASALRAVVRTRTGRRGARSTADAVDRGAGA